MPTGGVKTRTSGIMIPAYVETTEEPLAFYPIQYGFLYPIPSAVGNNDATMDAATEKYAMLGRVFMANRASGTKTMSSAGGTIGFRTSTVTFLSTTTTVNLGLQAISSSAGPVAQPDGTYTVGATVLSSVAAAGGVGIQTVAWNTIAMTSGSISLAHGDPVAVVWDMTARGGADSVIVRGLTAGYPEAKSNSQFPTTNTFIAGAWSSGNLAGSAKFPNVVLTFDDGTIAYIDGGTLPQNGSNQDIYNSTNSANERGLAFQVPFTCKIDGLWHSGVVTDANSDFSVTLYSDPLATGSSAPPILATQAFLGEQAASSNNNGLFFVTLPSEITLTRATDYAIAVTATGTTNINLVGGYLMPTGFSNYREFLPGGTTLRKVTRSSSLNDAFTEESPALTIYAMGVRISQLQSS